MKSCECGGDCEREEGLAALCTATGLPFPGEPVEARAEGGGGITRNSCMVEAFVWRK